MAQLNLVIIIQLMMSFEQNHLRIPAMYFLAHTLETLEQILDDIELSLGHQAVSSKIIYKIKNTMSDRHAAEKLRFCTTIKKESCQVFLRIGLKQRRNRFLWSSRVC